MTQQANKSIEPEQRSPFAQMNWENVDEPGAYVELGSGDLYRIPQEALIRIDHSENDGCFASVFRGGAASSDGKINNVSGSNTLTR